MIRKFVHISFATLAAVLLFASTGAAQSFDVAGGYAYRNEAGAPGEPRRVIEKGWFGAGAVNLNDSFGLFGQFSQHQEPVGNIDVTLSIFGGGPRISSNQRTGVTYFAQALIGRASVSTSGGVIDISEGYTAFQPAVGVDVKAGGTVGVRFAFAPTYIKDGSDDPWAYHFMVGIVVRGG